MISQLLTLVSLLMVATVLFIPILGLKRVFLLQLALMSLSHVYATGIALCATMMIYYAAIAVSERSEKAIIYSPRVIIYIWVTWFVFTLISWSLNGFSVRSVFQGVEFVFYGILISFVYDIGRRQFVTYDMILVSLCISSFFLSIVFIIVNNGGSSVWPVNLTGRNEGVFFLTLAGLGSALYLFEKHASWKKFFSAIVVLVVMVGIFSTGSRTGATASTIVVALYVWSVLFRFSLRFIILSLTLVMLMAVLVLPVGDYLENIFDIAHNYSNKERFSMLVTSYNLFLQKPFFGWGWGSIDFLMQKYSVTEGSYPHPHNTYARFLVELGVMGVFVFVAVILSVFYQFVKSLRLKQNQITVVQGITSLTIFLFAFTDALFYGADRALVLSLMLGLCLAMSASQKNVFV